MSWLDGVTNSKGIGLSRLQEIVKDKKPGVLQSTGSQSQKSPSKWTTTEVTCQESEVIWSSVFQTS